MKKVNINSRNIFYLITFLSVLMFIIGLTMPSSLSNSISTFTGLRGKYFEVADYLVVGAFCIWAWLIVIGLLFVPKNAMVIFICLVLLVPHIIYIVVLYGYSHGVLDILKIYVGIFSFGVVRL